MSLQPGVYFLETPIPNPKPDRRYRDNYTALPELPAGLYLVKEVPSRPGMGASLYLYKVGAYGTLSPGATEFELLAAALVPATPTVATVAATTDLEVLSLDVLQILVDSGKISLTDIEEAYTKAYDASEG